MREPSMLNMINLHDIRVDMQQMLHQTIGLLSRLMQSDLLLT